MERQDYTAVAKTLHWLIAALIFVMFRLAWTMGDFSGIQKFKLYNLHKSIGITILALIALRPQWRSFHTRPALPASAPRRARVVAHLWHFRPLRSAVSDAALQVDHDTSVGQAVRSFPIHRFSVDPVAE
jgi:cytochrome b561